MLQVYPIPCTHSSIAFAHLLLLLHLHCLCSSLSLPIPSYIFTPSCILPSTFGPASLELGYTPYPRVYQVRVQCHTLTLT